MAVQTGIKSLHATLSGTTADACTLTGRGKHLAISNQHATEKLWFRLGGTTAVASADENYSVPAGQTKVLDIPYVGQRVSIVGNGNAYSMEVL